MVSDNVTICPLCGGELQYYSTVKRKLKHGGNCVSVVYIRRMICCLCGKEHRALPSCVFPYKHYAADIIRGFCLDIYSTDDLIFENYPSEATIRRWRSEKPF